MTLYLVDISSFIFRAFFAIRSLTNKKGEPTNAIYGVANMLAKLLQEEKARHVGIVYDSKSPSFRKQMYAEYKANRSDAPPDLIPQFDKIEHLIRCMGLPSFRQDGVEADDVIATLAVEWCRQDARNRVIVVTGDKDLMQLADSQVKIWDTMINKTYGPAEVKEKFGVEPRQIRDYLALIGDSSDNIPGVPSIGPKSAVDLLGSYGDLESILMAARDGKIPGKKGEVLRNYVADARLSAELATLKMDCAVELIESQVRYDFHVSPECADFLRELDFHTLLAKWSAYLEVPPGSTSDTPLKLSEEVDPATRELAAAAIPLATRAVLLPPPDFRTVNTEAQLKTLLQGIETAVEFGFDLETTSLNPRAAEIVGIAICHDPAFACYIPVGHRGTHAEQLPLEVVMAAIRPYLENPKFKKIGQNLKYDFSVLRCQGIDPRGIGADTMIAAYVLEPEGRHNLETLAAQHLGYSMTTFEQICGKGKDQIGFDQVPVEVATRYSAEDAWIAYHLWRHLAPQLAEEGMMGVFAQVDLPLVDILSRMELEGVCIDEDYLKGLSQDFEKDMRRIEERIGAYTKGPVNLNSPKQLAQLLFEELKLPTGTKTKTGFSTDAGVLEGLAPLHEVPRLLLEYREVSKLKGTYVDPLPGLKDPQDGKIHASFHQAVAATGRLSSSDPNLQNIPIRSERGQKIRRAFIPSPGNVLLAADYSQIELRLLAHMSGDPALTESFLKDEDVHRRTAGDIFSIPPSEVDDRQRSIAKAINFGLMYGKTAFGLSQELKISRKEAQATIDRYFERYSHVKRFLDAQVIEAKEKGWTATLLGRKRRLPEIHARNPAVRANSERMAMNTPIQGTAADLVKLAMIELDEALRRGKFRSKLIIQVHDELVLDCPKSEAREVEKLVVEVMEGAMKLTVPLRVNASIGDNWMDL